MTGTSRVEIQPVTKVGGSHQAIPAGTIPAAMPQMATRTGELGPTMDPRAMPTTTKAGTHKARIATVLREEMQTMCKAGTTKAHTVTVLNGETRAMARIGTNKARIVTVLNGEMRAMAKTGTSKAQITIVLTEEILGAGLPDPGRLLTTPGLQAMPLVDGVTATVPTTTVFQATCRALGRTMQVLDPGSIVGRISLPKAGTILVEATLRLLVATAAMAGEGLLHLRDHRSPAKVVIKAGEEEATKVEVQRAIGTRVAEAQQVDGMITHPIMLDRQPLLGRRTSPVIPKVRQRIGSGSAGVGLGILPVMGMATGDEDYDASMRSVGALGPLVILLFLYCFSPSSVDFFSHERVRGT